ncbi:MAG: WXG100 family type VII secretion target [Clostridiales bacterium]|jgi:uncharacterized protein YukE|nr:WXG100 family type VII secretion target [Clostridiales bacterium]
MSAIALRVKPDVLINKSDECDCLIKEIRDLMDKIKNAIDSLRCSWISEASDAFLRMYMSLYVSILEIIIETIMKRTVQNLRESAQLYITAEKTATSAAEGLPTDGVTC